MEWGAEQFHRWLLTSENGRFSHVVVPEGTTGRELLGMNGAALGALFAGAGREGRASNEGSVWTIEAMGGRGLGDPESLWGAPIVKAWVTGGAAAVAAFDKCAWTEGAVARDPTVLAARGLDVARFASRRWSHPGRHRTRRRGSGSLSRVGTGTAGNSDSALRELLAQLPTGGIVARNNRLSELPV